MAITGRQPRLSRRAFLARAAGTAAAGATASSWLSPLPVGAQDANPATREITSLVTVLTGFGGNVVVYADGTNSIVVDSGAAEYARALSEEIETLTVGNPLTALINTHWHGDQIGGNAMLNALGAEIIAHEKTLAHLSIPYYLPGEDRYQQPLPPAAHPTRTFFTEGSLLLQPSPVAGERRISFGYLLEAHTDGDIYVHFEDENIIAAGDVISPERDPELDWFGGGWLGGRIDSLKLLLDLSDDDTKFVPSCGPVVNRDYVQTEHALMLELFDILFERIRAGESADDIHRSGALDTLPRRFDDPAKLLYDAHKTMWGHYNTLSHDIV